MEYESILQDIKMNLDLNNSYITSLNSTVLLIFYLLVLIYFINWIRRIITKLKRGNGINE